MELWCGMMQPNLLTQTQSSSHTQCDRRSKRIYHNCSFAFSSFAACHLLGDYLETIRKDFEKARKVYQSNCVDYNHAKSCLKFGNYVFIGRGKSGEKGNPAEALKYYGKGCDLGDADSCLHSGLINVSKQSFHDAPAIERNFALVISPIPK